MRLGEVCPDKISLIFYFATEPFLWPTLKNKVFPYAHGIQIKEIKVRLNDLRLLRNRIFHYGAIWHFQDLANKHDDLISAIKWIEPAAANILVDIDRFYEVYSKRPKIYGGN